MSSSPRFNRIAQDLEKLPCELHDAVLKDLEFEQLLRLSEAAGPRLIWSLENSLSLWGLYFREGNIPRLRSLLAITDSVRKHCFKPPKSKKTTSPGFERVWPPEKLRFLLFRGSDWSVQIAEFDQWYWQRFEHPTMLTKAALTDGTSLFNHWPASLNEIIINTTWSALHTDYHRFVEPWTTSVTGAAVIFRKIPFVGGAIQSHYDISLNAKQSALSVQEMQDFINLYQKLRQVRAEALAAELCYLADIYEAYPTHLKQPFAPQTQRLNEKHIPTGMRNEARKMTRRVAHTSWRDNKMCQSRFAFPFPDLVPYDWTLRLFVQVLQKHIVPELPGHKDIVQNAKIVHEGLPAWALSAHSLESLTEQVDRWAPKNTKYRKPLNISPIMWEKANRTHTEEDLEWLQKFGDVVTRMEKVFPRVLEDVRGPGWVVGAS